MSPLILNLIKKIMIKSITYQNNNLLLIVIADYFKTDNDLFLRKNVNRGLLEKYTIDQNLLDLRYLRHIKLQNK